MAFEIINLLTYLLNEQHAALHNLRRDCRCWWDELMDSASIFAATMDNWTRGAVCRHTTAPKFRSYWLPVKSTGGMEFFCVRVLGRTLTRVVIETETLRIYTHWRDYCKLLTFSISSRWNRRTCIACTIYKDIVS